MIASIEHKGETLKVDLHKSIDLSIPIGPNGPKAWYVDDVVIAPVINQHVVGSIQLGGAVNFNEVRFNPHGHGTHTESIGHISLEKHPMNNAKRDYFCTALLVSIVPSVVEKATVSSVVGDFCITREQLIQSMGNTRPEALVIRTLPNTTDKLTKDYSNSNFCYFESSALAYLAEIEIMHLLVDLPSVDRESDGGLLAGHKAFWQFPSKQRIAATITEFIFVPDSVQDGLYFMNLQLASYENDAVPSRPLLFEIIA